MPSSLVTNESGHQFDTGTSNLLLLMMMKAELVLCVCAGTMVLHYVGGRVGRVQVADHLAVWTECQRCHAFLLLTPIAEPHAHHLFFQLQIQFR